MKKYFSKKDFIDMMLILSVLRVKTNCFDAEGKVIRARYLVCIDDDITSAFYAAYMYHLIYAVYGYYPFVLCVGGVGMLSKYTNEKGESEGLKLRRVCMELGVASKDITVLDKGTNTGLNCLDIYKHLAKNPGRTIFCVTTRLSLRLERTFEFLPQQYPNEVNSEMFKMVKNAGLYWYVPEETAKNMMQVYNCKGLAKGVMLLAEVASIYDRIVKYSGKLQAPLSFKVPDEVVQASLRLAKKYPLKINWLNFTGIWEYAYAYFSVLFYKPWIKRDSVRAVKHVKKQLKQEFGL